MHPTNDSEMQLLTNIYILASCAVILLVLGVLLAVQLFPLVRRIAELELNEEENKKKLKKYELRIILLLFAFAAMFTLSVVCIIFITNLK